MTYVHQETEKKGKATVLSQHSSQNTQSVRERGIEVNRIEPEVVVYGGTDKAEVMTHKYYKSTC